MYERNELHYGTTKILFVFLLIMMKKQKSEAHPSNSKHSQNLKENELDVKNVGDREKTT